MEETERRTIPYATYLQVLGLLTLVDQHNKVMDDLRKALYATLGVEIDRFGHNDWCDEAIWNDIGIEELFDRLGIEVAPEPVPA
jgi:hypothetical protein